MDINASGSAEVAANEMSPDRVAAARARLKTGRNESCPCGSGRKYKKCCIESDAQMVRNADEKRRAKAPSSASAPAFEPLPVVTLGRLKQFAEQIVHLSAAGRFEGLELGAAAEEFIRAKRLDLLPEVAVGFCKLDARAYDADALIHIEDYLLAAHFEGEALHLAERFLPAAREA
jgi:hypothetical protein